ncbi:MAG: GHKL domain-containing protein [Myxococcales bacterium]|jgi:signal transduction histidine kinase|nr:GHKL domain-containing protein [Myxococcales bacterium]
MTRELEMQEEVAPGVERDSHERVTISNVPISREAVKRASEPITVPAAWLDTLLVATSELPVQEGEEAVAEAIVQALAQIAPEAGVGVCLVAPPDSRARAAGMMGQQRVFRYVPVGEEHRTSGVDPTRLFPGFAHERVIEVEPSGTTVHFASDDEGAGAASSPMGHLLSRATLGLARGLHFARAHAKAKTDATDLRALHGHMVQAEKLASFGQIAAGVVHELNNPLTSIVAYTDYLLKKGASDPADTERLRRIGESANRMLRFTRDLVTYARPSRDVPVPVMLHSVIDQALGFCEHVLAESRVVVDRRYADGDFRVQGMPEQLAQVFVNLVTNACHAMAAEGGHLVVSTSADSAGHVVVVVEDDGHGIAQEHLPNIFVPFFTTKEDGRGTGLGLSIVKSIVDTHDGEIWAENGASCGTRFVILLPSAKR